MCTGRCDRYNHSEVETDEAAEAEGGPTGDAGGEEAGMFAAFNSTSPQWRRQYHSHSSRVSIEVRGRCCARVWMFFENGSLEFMCFGDDSFRRNTHTSKIISLFVSGIVPPNERRSLDAFF